MSVARYGLPDIMNTEQGSQFTASVLDALQELVTRLDNGKGAVLARRVDLGKTTVHYWLKQGGTPALPAHPRIASQTDYRCRSCSSAS